MSEPHGSDRGERLRRDPVEVRLPDFGVFALESHHGPGFRMASSRHDFLEIFYVLHGAGRFLIEGTNDPCAAGDVVVVPVGREHRIEDVPDTPLSLYGLCVAPRVWRQEPTLIDHLPAGRQPLSGLAATQLRSDLRRLLFEQSFERPGSISALLGLTLQLLAFLARTSATLARGPSGHLDPTTPGLRQAVERYVSELRQRFFEPADLDSVANGLGMSRRRFTQLFRQVTGSSWADHLTALRIDYACRLLRETDRSIIAIAFESGFEDLSSFYRAFKRQTGDSPSRWRARDRRQPIA